MGIEQSALGKIILTLGSIAFVYYSIWVLSSVRFLQCSCLPEALFSYTSWSYCQSCQGIPYFRIRACVPLYMGRQ
jgi:hypothetical protein